jgi:nicotinamide-nucleotide amidase
MRVAIVAIGTELLLGQIVDSNSATIADTLAAHGLTSQLQFKV